MIIVLNFGSQVALTIPDHAKVLVAVGDKVQAGVTPIAQWTA